MALLTPAFAPAVDHGRFVAGRHVRAFLRQPAYVAITLVQAVVWLPLFGSLFRRVVDIPGFGGGSYIGFLTPGVVVMSALFSAGWSGMSFIKDIDGGLMDRMLTSPVRRSALISGSVVSGGLTIVVQSVIICLLGWALGAHFPNGVLGALVLIAAAVLLAAGFSSLSNALALVVRKEDSLIGAVTFVTLPLTFLSSAIMQRNLMPGWMRHVAAGNPVDWGVVAGREALSTSPDWATVGAHLGYLAAFAVVAGWLAIRAFRSYQRSI